MRRARVRARLGPIFFSPFIRPFCPHILHDNDITSCECIYHLSLNKLISVKGNQSTDEFPATLR